MINNIGPFSPPVSTPKKVEKSSRDAAVAGSETNKDPETLTPQYVESKENHRKRGKDRRKRNIKPLIDLRCGRDRREDPDKPSINIKI